MSIQPITALFPENSTWKEHCEKIRQAEKFSELVWCCLQAGLWVACWVCEQELNERAKAAIPWPVCPHCGTQLHSKGRIQPLGEANYFAGRKFVVPTETIEISLRALAFLGSNMAAWQPSPNHWMRPTPKD